MLNACLREVIFGETMVDTLKISLIELIICYFKYKISYIKTPSVR